MWGITEIVAGALKLWGYFFSAKNAAPVVKAEQINAENLKKQNFDADIAIASDSKKSDEERQAALDRIRGSIARTPQ